MVWFYPCDGYDEEMITNTSSPNGLMALYQYKARLVYNLIEVVDFAVTFPTLELSHYLTYSHP